MAVPAEPAELGHVVGRLLNPDRPINGTAQITTVFDNVDDFGQDIPAARAMRNGGRHVRRLRRARPRYDRTRGTRTEDLADHGFHTHSIERTRPSSHRPDASRCGRRRPAGGLIAAACGSSSPSAAKKTSTRTRIGAATRRHHTDDERRARRRRRRRAQVSTTHDGRVGIDHQDDDCDQRHDDADHSEARVDSRRVTVGRIRPRHPRRR